MIHQMDGQECLFAPDTWCGKTFPEPLAATEEKILQRSSKKQSKSQSRKPQLFLYLRKGGPQVDALWVTNGALRGEFSTRSFGECPNAAVESRLSQILEAEPHPKYCLSAKACQGILNRAARRGKDLPEALKAGLLTQSESGGGCDGGGKGALVQEEKSGTLGCNNDQTVFCLQGNGIDRANSAAQNGGGWRENVAYTLNTIDRPAVCAGFSASLGAKAHGIAYMDEQAPTLSSQRHDASVLCLNDQGGRVIGVTENVSGTIRVQEHGHQPTVLDMSHACDVVRDCGGITPSLQARMGTGGNQVPLVAYGIGNGQVNEATSMAYGKAQTLNTMHDAQAVFCQDVAHSLKAKANCDFREDSETYPVTNGSVRRLTPLECERLQGFPDGWTDIGDWVDSKGKKRQTTDSARYKALGNSIALPPWKWVLKRLCAQYERDATMASLFDGIGGFPLIWEQLNGKGSCLWASEIEEFPMAVTKRRFP